MGLVQGGSNFLKDSLHAVLPQLVLYANSPDGGATASLKG